MTAPEATAGRSTDQANLLPRRYQEEVFTRAQKENIIAALSTGSGKTLISLLLIKWISTQESAKGKVIVFIVPQIALVEQQGNFISQNTPLRVIKLHGQSTADMDPSDREGWKARFDNHDVFVLTAQVFLNILTHSLWSVDRVSLLIFDECHHARKKHPYRIILNEYFLIKPFQRPKIFGMTASPIWNHRDAAGSLATLEANMDAKVIGVYEHADELAKHSPKPVEVIVEFDYPPEEYVEYPSPMLHKCLCVFDKYLWEILSIPWENLEMRYYSTYHSLGPFSASMFLYLEFQYYIAKFFSEYKAKLYESAMDGMDIEASNEDTGIPIDDIYQVQDILDGFESYFTYPADGPVFSVPLSWCTPKIGILVNILREYYTPTFQGIIFVEQRQDAVCLTKLFSLLSELKGVITCACLVGQGASEGIARNINSGHTNTVKLFREKKINILIATAVAEEGLDFPACDIVIRFDALQHMVGYVQSRGRARNKSSTFILMIQKGNAAQLARYQALREKEPEVNSAYQTRPFENVRMYDDDFNDGTHPADLNERERYVVPTTGAILTYDNAINLLNFLCALIPRDAFTPVHVPKYYGEYQSTMTLPTGLPLPRNLMTFTGPSKRSKKEAKRAVAFLAVKNLYECGVYDDYLLPISGQKSAYEDADGRRVRNVRDIPYEMEVFVKNPWTMGSNLWIHPIVIDGRRVAGLVTGTQLPPVQIWCGKESICTELGQRLEFGEEDEHEYMMAMAQYTKLGITYRVTGSPINSPLSLFLLPLTLDARPDFEAVNRLLSNRHGNLDWSGITDDACDRLLVMNVHEPGRIYLLRRIRHDLTPMSVPPPGAREDGHPTYFSFFSKKWTRKSHVANVPSDGPLLEAYILSRSLSGFYSLKPQDDSRLISTVSKGGLIPQGCTRWLEMPQHIYRAFEVLPALCHRITSSYRAQRARLSLSLPPISENLMIEAITLPCVNDDWSNQRMETLGDAVLKLCTTIHLLNKFPNRHEGQLTKLRQLSISNRYLMARAKDVDLEQFLTSEIVAPPKWRYMLGEKDFYFDSPNRSVLRSIPRRSLQDCMESVLGASFLSGGIPAALQTGTALSLTFGGSIPWHLRYSRDATVTPASPLFIALQDSLGYTFRQNRLLVEAVTHPSFVSSLSGPSYQRLEFLGDALLDLVVVKYLYDKFPDATSHQLAWPRSRAVCAPSLAYLAVSRLGLHLVMLANSVELSIQINRYASIFENVQAKDMVYRGWQYDPPKAISDLFESVVGAVLVDSNYDYELTASVVEHVMKDILEELSPSLPKDPVSELTEWASISGCQQLVFEKQQKERAQVLLDGIAVLVHGKVVIGPIICASLGVAKFLAAERALAILRDESSEKSLFKLCDCGKTALNGTNLSIDSSDAMDMELDELDEEWKEMEETVKFLTQVVEDEDVPMN